jgi:two-component system, NtrC family, response regulator AtoC
MRKKPVRILIVEDDRSFGASLQRMLDSDGIQSDLLTGGSKILTTIASSPPDLILLDLELGKESGIRILRDLNESGNEIPVVIMAEEGSMETVAEALHLNAVDYITKPFGKTKIAEMLGQIVDSERKQNTQMLHETTGKTIPIIGQSPGMVEVYKAIARVARTDSTVLIMGESGTGKEIVARAIHEHSLRSKKAFLAVNCGALTETLLESELFGHTKGSFTGALQSHLGIFENASGGTVFLDEISETSPAFQVKLLRVLQQRTVRPVGGTEEKPVDIRVISATNQSLKTLMNSTFRKDLLYRISVINIHIPPLRERVEDIPLLANHFLRRHNRRQRKSVVLRAETIDWMKQLPWHGNVRELENAIERAVTMSISSEIHPRDFVQFGFPFQQEEAGETMEDPESQGSIDQVTRNHILKVLGQTGGSKLKAAKILGIARPSLYRMARRLGIDLDAVTESAKNKNE